jgi:acetyl-CoA acetyltransferase family protein
MAFEKAYIPYGGYWSSPFCRWQGALSEQNSVELVARTAARFLGDREIGAERFDGLVLGFTVPQHRSFYGGPWSAVLAGLPGITGPMVSQACATSARALYEAAAEVETGMRTGLLTLTADRTSNGPHIYYPSPAGVGGRGKTEEWVWDNFNADPNTKMAMLATAENVAKKAGITKEEQDELTLIRNEQYQASLADDRAFQKRYMYALEIPKGRKKTITIETDEGVFPTTAEGLAGLRPVMPDGTVSFGTQTYPADGNAGMIVTTKEQATELSKDGGPVTQILSFGDARVEKAHMPMAVVPAAQQALERAGIQASDCVAIKTHNPFAVNDVYFSKQMGIPFESFNNNGSPLVYGHPQGPTGMRVIVEMIEEIAMKGGGYGLFSGCAAGDTAMAAVFKVG